MSSLNDYVKFLTQQAVMRMDQPKEERRTKKMERRADRPPFSSHAFGIIPLGISLFWKKRSTKRKFKK
ncbi:YqzE family protein [Alkalihalobacillus sp. MEB130]|uniref:YqzE family protein n=1 Tax=Alkalihalobacillus sp. MEB130 TaxID=2976704 RepID=UPI0028DFA485|nr:YqzE family protein [Alkalihalobacillus sp. MEB130]MDT8863033.1 YqzE family protein [Alkalihalobacillus sp. MEB130]